MLLDYIKQLCRERGLTLKELAEAAGLAPNTISRWGWRGESVSDESLEAVARVLDISAWELEKRRGGEGRPTRRPTDYERVCPECGVAFIAHSPAAVYCSEACRLKRLEERRQQRENERAARSGGLAAFEAEARRQGLSYGQLRARQYIAEHMKKPE